MISNCKTNHSKSDDDDVVEKERRFFIEQRKYDHHMHVFSKRI